MKESDKVELFDSFGKECEKQIEKAIFNIKSSRRDENYLITTYFKNLSLETIENQEFLYQLFELLSYIQTLRIFKFQ